MPDQLLQDQLDLYGRLLADPVLVPVSILLESKGVSEADIDQSLSVLNERGGKIGACLVVLMPTLTPDSPNAPGPFHTIRQTVQVIEQPLFNLDATAGTLLPASALAERVRQLGHHFAGIPGLSYAFAGMEPAVVDAGKVSYLVSFQRRANDASLPRVNTPTISASQPAAPATVTLACTTPAAAITYSLDGSYPTTPYTAPFVVATTSTIRTAATATGFQQSNIAQLTVT
jgi:hypothetical protein